MAHRDEVARMSRILQILWFAFVAATFIYAAVAVVIVRGRAADPGGAGVAGVAPETAATLKPLFYALSVLFVAGAFWIRRRSFARSYSGREHALMSIQAAAVGGWALTEAVAIFGLVLVLLGGRVVDGAPFLLVSLGAMLAQRPSAGWLEEKVGSAPKH